MKKMVKVFDMMVEFNTAKEIAKDCKYTWENEFDGEDKEFYGTYNEYMRTVFEDYDYIMTRM